MFAPALAAGLACGAAPERGGRGRPWPATVDAGLLGYDPAQFIQNFLTVIGLLFSLLVGNTFVFLYTQQEGVLRAFREARARPRARRTARRAPRAPL